MIYIDRDVVEIPAALAEDDSKAARERKKVKKHYRDPNCTTYTFKVYKDKEVLAAINNLFNNKCAYCESSYTATSPTDIEHFRPKGRITDEPTHQGYWWLASTWNNLLPSCILCNREQHNDSFNLTETGIIQQNIKSGKYDHFPLAGTYRAFTETDDLSREDPLLIDPTQRDPAEYIIWREAHNLHFIVPKHNDNTTKLHAETSIKIYGLNRRSLVEERTFIANSIKVSANRLARLLSFASTLSNTHLLECIDIIDEEMERFVKEKEINLPFSGMRKYLINKELESMLSQLQTIKDKCKNA